LSLPSRGPEEGSQYRPPPLSPVMIAGLAMRPLPLAGLQPLLALSARLIERRHHEVIERLSAYGETRFIIAPTELPFRLLLVLNSGGLELTAFDKTVGDGEEDHHVAARIEGPLLSLIRLLEGKEDGDALFFSRELTVIGNMEAVVALKNAVDGAEIDLVEDILKSLGPLAGVARRVADGVWRLGRRASADLEAVGSAIREPLLRRIDAQNAVIRNLERRLSELDNPSTRRKGPLK